MTSDKRMSDERLEEIRGDFEGTLPCDRNDPENTIGELLAEIDALRAARRVEDGEAAFAITWLRERARKMSGDTIASCNMQSAADLLTRLSAAKEDAERREAYLRSDRMSENDGWKVADDLKGKLAQAERERDGAREALEALMATINSPCTDDFIKAVPLEATHQVERWGADHDDGKTPLDWFWLLGYLSQKAVASVMAGDREKYRHHIITTGAALLNWFKQAMGEDSRMRPGIATPAALSPAPVNEEEEGKK